MKKKEIIVTTLVTIVLVGGTVGYKLLSKDTSTKVNVKQEDNKSITIKDLTGEKPKSSGNSKKIDYKNLYTVANKEGNTASNKANVGYIAQQEKWTFFNDNGLSMALTDLKTGWKKINNDKASGIEVIGDWIYYNNTLGQLVKVKVDGSDKKVIINEKAGVFTIKDDWIYFVQGEQLCKMKTDGTERILIMENGCLFLTLHDNYIYYIKSNDKGLWRVFQDGSNEQKLVDNCNMFIVNGDWIYYRDYSLGLNKVKLDGSSQMKAIEDKAYVFGIGGDYIYYTTDDVINGTKELRRVKLDGTEKTKIYDIKNLHIGNTYTINITTENVCLCSLVGKDIYKFKK